MAALDYGKAVNEFVQAVGKEGAFALGTLLGCGISGLMIWFANRENAAKHKIDFEREKELRGLLEIKEARISALHDEVGNQITVRKNEIAEFESRSKLKDERISSLQKEVQKLTASAAKSKK